MDNRLRAPDHRSSGAILLAIDGEPHTEAAVHWALTLAEQQDRELVAVHVRDPYLKQFHNEIYAQGRLEYLAHVEECLTTLAAQANEAFCVLARGTDVRWRIKTLDGDPIEQLAQEAATGAYGLLVVGRRPRKGFAAWRSRDLPGKILAAVPTPPILFVPESETGPPGT